MPRPGNELGGPGNAPPPAFIQPKPDVASAAALGVSGAGYYTVTGTTTITSLPNLQEGTVVVLEFDGILTLTRNATTLILQGAVNLTTAAGDIIALRSEGSGNWRELWRRLAAAAAAAASGGTPAPVLSTTNAAGVATTFLRTDDQLAVFDATVPVTQAFSDAAGAGTAAVSARRDHRHGMPASSAGTDISVAAQNSVASISISNATTTVVTYDQDQFDTDTMHSTVSNTGRLTATTAGKYFIWANITWVANATGHRWLVLQLNGLTDIAQVIAAGHATQNQSQFVGCMYNLAATDYVEVRARQDSGAALNLAFDNTDIERAGMFKVLG